MTMEKLEENRGKNSIFSLFPAREKFDIFPFPCEGKIRYFPREGKLLYITYNVFPFPDGQRGKEGGR